MSKRELRAYDALNAIRLALRAADDDHAAVVVIGDIVGHAPMGDKARSEPVRILLDAIKRKRGKLKVAA